MQLLTQENIDRLIPYWKPEEGVEYNNVCMGDWRIKTNKNFNKEELCLSVHIVDGLNFNPPKDFSTSSAALIKQLWPIIDRAQKEGRAEIYVSMKLAGKKYAVFDLAPKLRQQFSGVKLGQ